MESPYSQLPNTAFWQRAIADLTPGEVDPVSAPAPFQIGLGARVVTAGSCFAQHIARYLKGSGFNVLIAEPAHPIATAETAAAFNYGVFSARYGNIYTARQLLQLFQRAYGTFEPQENVWEGKGCWIDPFRPRIQPGGFTSRQEFEADRRKHFAAVRRAFEELDLFVFTLGLTESWRSRADGAVFPLCPGVAGGTFDSERHEFHNFSATEVAGDLCAFIDGLRTVNPKAKVLLTVSPVPLVATAESQHVLVSTVYSKSVLRVAAAAACEARSDVVYFPSYEIVTGTFSRGTYFGPDCRSVTEEGVNHVMRIFFRHFTAGEVQVPAAPANPELKDSHIAQMERVVEVICEEEMLDISAQDDRIRRRDRRAERRRKRAQSAIAAE